MNRSITGVFDEAAGTPPGSPQPAATKKPLASRRVSGIWDSSTEPGIAGHRNSIESQGGDTEIDPDALLTAALDTDTPVKSLLAAIADHPTISRLQWMGGPLLIWHLGMLRPGGMSHRMADQLL